MSRTIILVGGAPTVGKSTMAELLSKELNLPWLSTDQTREVMRTFADPEKHRELFNEGHETAESFFADFSAEQVCDMEFAQGYAAWPANKNLIENDYTWRSGFILEGVNILPELVARDFSDKPEIKVIFLVDHDSERMKQVIYTRGLWGDARSYSDDIKETELEWAMMFNKRLEQQAEQFGLPVVEVSKSDTEDLKKALEALGL